MRRRIEWIDLVKAVSVLLVVFMHASNTLVDLAGPSGVTAVLQHINHLLEPMRMPVFFLVSGMLASSAVHRPWSKSGNRTLGMVYLYLVWMLLFFGFITVFGSAPSDPVSSILFAKSGFWYLYAMALFFVIARLLRNQPAWVVVAVALLPNILRPLTDQVVGQLVPGSLYTSMAMNLAFFLIGAYFKDIVGGLAEKVTTWHAMVFGALSVTAGLLWLDTPYMVGQSLLPLSLLWVPFGVSVAVLVTRDGAPAWSKYVGARTLSIYVMQWPVIFLLGTFLPGGLLAHPVVALVFPFAVTAAVAALALWLHSLPALRSLFVAPRWVTHPHELPVFASLRPQAPAPEPVTVTAGR